MSEMIPPETRSPRHFKSDVDTFVIRNGRIILHFRCPLRLGDHA
jgi:hypothetical protein